MPTTTTGFICVFIAMLGFGSNFVPVKRFETGDGMFFQWVLCCAIWCCGVVVYCFQGCPTFQPVAMLGGAIWATGNIMSVPIIKTLGLSLGLLIWGQTNMIVGWATGYFGLFGVKSQANQISTPSLNFVGVGLAVVALSLYVFIKPNDNGSGDNDDSVAPNSSERLLSHAARNDYASMSTNTPRLLGNETYQPVNMKKGGAGRVTEVDAMMGGNNSSSATDASASARPSAAVVGAAVEQLSPFDALPKATKRLIGVAMSVISGLFYGSTFTPPQVVAVWGPSCYGPNRTEGRLNLPGCGDKDMLDYVFPHFTGIFLTSTFYFLCYCAYMNNRPRIYPEAILPAFASGIMWAIAQSCWFVANSALGFALAFPLITSGPGFIASMWGVCLFQEVKGVRNFTVLGVALIITVASGLCIAMSRGGGGGADAPSPSSML
jgi:glucose uptake protein GlcU